MKCPGIKRRLITRREYCEITDARCPYKRKEDCIYYERIIKDKQIGVRHESSYNQRN